MRLLSVWLAPLLALSAAWGQTSGVSAESAAQTPLHVHVVDDPGPAAPNAVAAKGYIVQVTNSEGGPVAGVAVAFRLPEQSPTGRFADGLRAWVSYTDAAGIASFPVIHWGDSAGPVELRITAAKGSAHAGLLVEQRIGPETASTSVVVVPVAKAEPPRAGPPPPPAQLTPPQIAELAPDADLSKPLADVIDGPISKTGAAAPGARTLKPTQPASAPADEPSVVIVNTPTGAGPHDIHKKWVVLTLVGAAAGVGAFLALNAHAGGAGGASTSGVAIGAPSISIGH